MQQTDVIINFALKTWEKALKFDYCEREPIGALVFCFSLITTQIVDLIKHAPNFANIIRSYTR